MSRLIVAFALVLIGCESNPELPTENYSKPELTSSNSSAFEDSNAPKWRLIDSNEWYDLFELILTDSSSMICTAFHKTDAQLGIGIMFEIAILADGRGFKYFTTQEAEITEEQARMLNPLLPGARVLESYFFVEYSIAKPKNSDNHIFDAELITQMKRNQTDD